MFKSNRKKHLFLISLLVWSVQVFADNLLVDNYPSRYTVVKGDTLWDISSRFLNEPWRWSEIWNMNPQVKDPHWIYPGDQLSITYVNGRPQLQVTNRKRLSPKIRREFYNDPITALPAEVYLQFMSKPYVLSENEVDDAPYIVSFSTDHLIGSRGEIAYVRKLKEPNVKYEIIRQGKAYKDGQTGEVLGYEARYIGTAKVVATGDPSTVKVIDSEKELFLGDKLIPSTNTEALEDFYPKHPKMSVYGTIIDLFDAVFQVGQYGVVVIDRGADDGLESGDVLEVSRQGRTIRDRFVPGLENKLTLPNEYSGQVMIFRTFERVSFAIVLESNKTIRIGDPVGTTL